MENRELPHLVCAAGGGNTSVAGADRGWLEGEIPELPEGLSLRLPEEETGLRAGCAFLTGERRHLPAGRGTAGAFLPLSGRAKSGSGREFAMERIALRQGLTLTPGRGRSASGPRRRNRTPACSAPACTMRLFCIRLGKEERGTASHLDGGKIFLLWTDSGEQPDASGKTEEPE